MYYTAFAPLVVNVSQLVAIFTHICIISNICKKIKWLQSEMIVLDFVNEEERLAVHDSRETVRSSRPVGITETQR